MWEEYSTCPPVRSCGMFGIWVIVCTCVCVLFSEKVAVSTPRPCSSLSAASSSSSLTTSNHNNNGFFQCSYMCFTWYNIAPPEDRKELFKRYQMKMKEMKKSRKGEGKISPKNINVRFLINGHARI